MKKKFFLLLSLFAGAVTGVMAETVFSVDVIAKANVAFENGTTEITSDQATITGGKMYAISEQEATKNLIGAQNKVYYFCMTNNNTYFKIELDKALAAGDTLSAITYSRTDTNLGLFVSTASSRPGSCDTKLSLDATEAQSQTAFSDYIVAAGDGLEGATTIYIYRETGKSTYFDLFTIKRADAAAPAHTHSYATEWSSDEKGHWHACTGEGECDAPKADEAAHVYGTEGDARYTCTVCAYVDEAKKAEAEAADGEAAVENVIAKIAAIDSVTYTAECKAKIDAARAAYDALAEAQQAEVTNYEDLVAAEAAYAELKKAAAEAEYTVAVKEGTEDAENWVATPNEAKPGTTVTVKYKGAKQIKSIKFIKK